MTHKRTRYSEEFKKNTLHLLATSDVEQLKADVRRLQRENEILRQEREILKKR